MGTRSGEVGAGRRATLMSTPAAGRRPDEIAGEGYSHFEGVAWQVGSAGTSRRARGARGRRRCRVSDDSARAGPTHVNVSEIVSPAPDGRRRRSHSSSGRQATSSVPWPPPSSAVPPTSSPSPPPTTQRGGRAAAPHILRGRGVGVVDRRCEGPPVNRRVAGGDAPRVAVVSHEPRRRSGHACRRRGRRR